MTKKKNTSPEYLKQAYERGKTAKSKKFMRVSPFYEEPDADKYWFAGFDGRKLEELTNVDALTMAEAPALQASGSEYSSTPQSEGE